MTRASLDLFERVAKQLLLKHNGYAMEVGVSARDEGFSKTLKPKP